MLDEARDLAYICDIVRAGRKTVESLRQVDFSEYIEDEDLRLTVERR
jgi:hypothetical protein